MWRGIVKTGAAIYEANWIAATRSRRAARKSQLPPNHETNTKPLPSRPLRCHRTLDERIHLTRHLQTRCNMTISHTASANASIVTHTANPTTIITGGNTPDAPTPPSPRLIPPGAPSLTSLNAASSKILFRFN
ncbi:hypothetical protein SprV_0401455300 [Sparganum proliferum]